jgi:hypothetical protein
MNTCDIDKGTRKGLGILMAKNYGLDIDTESHPRLLTIVE